MAIEEQQAPQHSLSYDKILKNTLQKSKETTIRFINGLFGDDIPLGAPVEWLDKETVGDKHNSMITDFYPRIDGKMYVIEVEQGGSDGNMAVRVFKYAVEGAMLHSMSSTKTGLNVTFPQPAVIFLKGTRNTPKSYIWNIGFFDGQKVRLEVPTVILAELSVKEIARRGLFPIGQFYLRTFEPLSAKKVGRFKKAAEGLITELKTAVDRGTVSSDMGLSMQQTIKSIMENVIAKSRQEAKDMDIDNLVETIPWIDYGEVIAELEERAKTKGMAEGKAKGELSGIEKNQKEIANIVFDRMNRGASLFETIETLRELKIPEHIIASAQKQFGIVEK